MSGPGHELLVRHPPPTDPDAAMSSPEGQAVPADVPCATGGAVVLHHDVAA